MIEVDHMFIYMIYYGYLFYEYYFRDFLLDSDSSYVLEI